MFGLSEQQFRPSCYKNLYQFRKEAFKGALANRWHSASHSSCGLGDVLTMKHCHWRCVHYLQTTSSIQYLWQAMHWYRQKTNIHLLSSCLCLYNSYVLSAHRVSNVTELDNFECYVHTVDRFSEYLWASKALFPYNMYDKKYMKKINHTHISKHVGKQGILSIPWITK